MWEFKTIIIPILFKEDNLEKKINLEKLFFNIILTTTRRVLFVIKFVKLETHNNELTN